MLFRAHTLHLHGTFTLLEYCQPTEETFLANIENKKNLVLHRQHQNPTRNYNIWGRYRAASYRATYHRPA